MVDPRDLGRQPLAARPEERCKAHGGGHCALEDGHDGHHLLDFGHDLFADLPRGSDYELTREHLRTLVAFVVERLACRISSHIHERLPEMWLGDRAEEIGKGEADALLQEAHDTSLEKWKKREKGQSWT